MIKEKIIRKGKLYISHIACNGWYTNNLLSQGLLMKVESNTIFFIFDTSVNFRTKSPHSNSIDDARYLKNNIEEFEELQLFYEKRLKNDIVSGLKSLKRFIEKPSYAIRITYDLNKSKDYNVQIQDDKYSLFFKRKL